MAATQMEQPISYEIEIRFCAPDVNTAFATLPFLESSLGPEKAWQTAILDPAIYARGELLRIGYVPPTTKARVYLGYKGVDEGSFANIRQEWGEEVTAGVTDSAILARLGLPTMLPSATALVDTLTAAGHTPFMEFAGVDRLGYVPELEIHTKLMRCPKILGDQVMVELEMAATSKAESLAAEAKLQQIAAEYAITERLLRDEPPTLLYQVSFPSSKPR